MVMPTAKQLDQQWTVISLRGRSNRNNNITKSLSIQIRNTLTPRRAPAGPAGPAVLPSPSASFSWGPGGVSNAHGNLNLKFLSPCFSAQPCLFLFSTVGWLQCTMAEALYSGLEQPIFAGGESQGVVNILVYLEFEARYWELRLLFANKQFTL